MKANDKSFSLQKALYAKFTTLEDKCNKVQQSVIGQQLTEEGAFDYVSALYKHQVVADLNNREVKGWKVAEEVKYLKQYLEDELAGCHRLPALLHDVPRKRFNDPDIGLEDYEVIGVEPLHTITGHLRNLFEELPQHMKPAHKKYFEKALDAVFGDKQVKRGCDYRKALIELTSMLRPKLDDKFMVLFETMCEIQEICYSRERTPQLIFRFANLVFTHAITLVDSFLHPKKLTPRKFFGQYFHSLLHAPLHFRLFPMPSINAEDEERMFTILKKFAQATSNHHPDNVLANGFLRIQVREVLTEEKLMNKRKRKCKSIVSKVNVKPKKRSQTVIPASIINAYPYIWQAHCESIADFLALQNNWIERKDGIVLCDLKPNIRNFKMSHFRSFTLAKELKRVKDIWNDLLKNDSDKIPCHKVKINEEGEVRNLSTLTLIKRKRNGKETHSLYIF